MNLKCDNIRLVSISVVKQYIYIHFLKEIPCICLMFVHITISKFRQVRDVVGEIVGMEDLVDVRKPKSEDVGRVDEDVNI